MTWVLDLDGVVWRGDVAIDGSVEAIVDLQKKGERIVYASNNSAHTTKGYIEKLASFGIDSGAEDIVHGGHAVAEVINPGETVLLSGGEGIEEVLAGKAEVIRSENLTGPTPEVDVVVVGWRPDYEIPWLSRAVQAVLNGARLVAPSADPVYPVRDTYNIGGGALAAAVEFATDTKAIFAGKPNQPIADVLKSRITNEIKIVVGDQIRTDGHLAQRLNAPFALVLSGSPQKPEYFDEVPIAITADDLAQVVRQHS